MSEDKRIHVPLSSGADAVLRCLFIHGPTWDGDVPSKSGRDELVSMGLAIRYEGFQQLTLSGLKVAVSSGLDREKERRQSEVSGALHMVRSAKQQLAGALSSAN